MFIGEISIIIVILICQELRLVGPVQQNIKLPLPEGMCGIFRKKAKIGKIFENLGKNVQNLKISSKKAGDHN